MSFEFEPVRAEENPAWAWASLGLPVLAGGGFLLWRRHQRSAFLAKLKANPPFSRASNGHEQLVDQYVPWFSTINAEDAWIMLVGHPETWTEWASQYVPGLTAARETAADVNQSVKGGVNRAQETRDSAKSWLKSWF